MKEVAWWEHNEPGVEYKSRPSALKDEGWRAYQEQISGLKPTEDGRIPEITVPDPDNPGKHVSFDGRTFRGILPRKWILKQNEDMKSSLAPHIVTKQKGLQDR